MRLDTAYANAPFIPDAEAYLDRWPVAARTFRERETLAGRAMLNQPYGEHERTRYDLFLPAGRPAGLVVLIHGGYWMRFGREDFSQLAAGPVAAGWACALPSYPLCPEVRVADITRHVARAVVAAAARVPAGPLVVTGHSAGGHLAARMACLDVPLPEPVRNRLARILPVSGLSDLRPFLETTMGVETLHLDPAEAEAESPALTAAFQSVDTHIWVGGAERPAFLDQSRWLAGAWPHARLTIDPERHHYDVIGGFERPDTPLMAALLGGLAA